MAINLADWFRKIFEAFVSTIKKIVEAIINNPETDKFLNSAWQIVLTEVTALDEISDLASEDKRKTAFGNIEDKVKAAGIKYTDWLINYGIETAVAYLRTIER